MTIVCVNPCTDPLWQQLVDQSASSIFHTSGWMRVLAETYDFDVQAYIVLGKTGAPEAGIPFARIDDIVGERTVTLPFSDYCDPLVSNSHQWSSLAGKLSSEHRPVFVRCLHNCLPLADERFAPTKRAKWHGMDLRSDVNRLWEGLHDSSKRAIRRAQRHEVVVRIARSEEELRAFFELHLQIRKYKYHLLAQPYRFFERLWYQFIEKSNGILLSAFYRDKLIGGILFLEWKDVLYYKFNASAVADLTYRPNDLLIWEGIKYAKAKGCTLLDFGLSDLDQDGLIRFKGKFATEEKTISFLRHVPPGAPTQQGNKTADLLPQLTNLFTEGSVPDHITAKAGKLLYRFFA
jgi:CelD/BcsL family acetyltransferase involved in cellulose biosynthesis